MNKILIVEDESVIFEPLAQRLSDDGFKVTVAETIGTAGKALEKNPDLILLDWNLPDGSGLDFLKTIRGHSLQVPVIFLTARTDLLDRVLGLEMGADDYQIKPFEYRELLARVRARLRGSQHLSPSLGSAGGVGGGSDEGGEGCLAKPGQARQDRSQSIRVDSGAHRAYFQDQEINLTPMEFKLLEYFLQHPGQVFARDELLDKVWGFEAFPTTRTVDTHVLQLRQKFVPCAFETVRKIGYRYCPENLRKNDVHLTGP